MPFCFVDITAKMTTFRKKRGTQNAVEILFRFVDGGVVCVAAN